MINQVLSNRLWSALERKASKKLHEFITVTNDSGVRLEEFTVKRYRDGIGIETHRTYYRMVRDTTGAVLYDQLENVTEASVVRAESGYVPDLAISPSRANTLMAAAMEQQAEVDRLIEEARV